MPTYGPVHALIAYAQNPSINAHADVPSEDKGLILVQVSILHCIRNLCMRAAKALVSLSLRCSSMR